MTHDSALPAVPEGMKRWDGGGQAPDDWDGKTVLTSRSGWCVGPFLVSEDWRHGSGDDIIAYTPRPTEQPAPEGSAPGMTLRDWFAGQVIPAVVVTCAGDSRDRTKPIETYFAGKAYSLADAMLTERERQP